MKPRNGPPQRGGKRRQQQKQPEVMYRRAAPVGPPPERENSRQAYRRQPLQDLSQESMVAMGLRDDPAEAADRREAPRNDG